ncbi:hypothetical protein [Bacillus sp. FJAT-28004]|uniref:hypothetical protein n=1 Tax=Bacillus sp. FJAT-28004 TaxID=1679165 RepID=UPI0006B472EB|nr:hypothetical protein [Bacillus sp. FJAT-28004]
MKLRGTLSEQTYRTGLQASRIYLFNDKDMHRFLNIISETFPAMKTACILDWIPEQGEDIFTFLVDTHSVLKIELDRYDKKVAPIVDMYSIEDWTKGLSKMNQIKIAVALDLAKQDISQGHIE